MSGLVLFTGTAARAKHCVQVCPGHNGRTLNFGIEILIFGNRLHRRYAYFSCYILYLAVHFWAGYIRKQPFQGVEIWSAVGV